MSSQSLTYRPEIDGLRAVAVFAVMIYHAKFELTGTNLLPGGFLGVDIFFVISGFLITSLLRDEWVETGRISFVGFYGRRIRRLLPALFLVMIVSLPLAWEILLPGQLLEFAKSQLASILFVSNFFWDVSLQEYGAESALLAPFLHTWSLAVEEQFYLLFPLLFVLLGKFGSAWLWRLLMALGVASFGLAVWIAPVDNSSAFYMLHTRFWELLAGSLLALQGHRAQVTGISRHLPYVGMAGILISLVWVEYSDGHPGWITLLPVFGTVLFIGFASPANALVRLLSARFFVGVGLISYALYLWHYPIFAFGRMFTWHPGLSEKALWIVLTVGLALSSYWLVEKPLRNRRRVSWRTYFAVTGGALGVILLANGAWILGGGYPDRADYVHRLIKDSQHVDLMQDGRRCHSGGLNQPYFNVDDSCEFTHFPDASYLMLVGDSHAGNLAHSAYRLARESGLNFIQVTQAGCSHLLYQTQGGLCRSRAKRLRQLLKKHPNSTIVYSARLPLYLEMVGFDGGEGFREAGYPAAGAEEVAEHQPLVRQSILSTVQGWLDSGHNVVLVYPVPEQGFHASYMLAHQRPPILEEADLPLLSTSMAVFKARTASSYAALDELQGQNLSRVYPEKLFCREATGRCLVTEGERLYFLVDNHVARLGAEMIMSEVSEVLGLEVPPEGRL